LNIFLTVAAGLLIGILTGTTVGLLSFWRSRALPPYETGSIPTPGPDRFWKRFAVAASLVALAMILIPALGVILYLNLAIDRQGAAAREREAALLAQQRAEIQLRPKNDPLAKVPDTTAQAPVSDEPADLRQARARLAELRVRYSDNYPLVQAQLQRVQELERLTKNESGASPNLNEAKAKLAALRAAGLKDSHPTVAAMLEKIRALEEK
jgi:hypothetical protein